MQPTIDESPQPKFTWAGGEASQLDREPRVHFKQCVRVVPIGGPPRAYRVLAANLSRQGMFLKMPTPFDTGTKVALSLEAGGQVLPFAQGEVVWRDLDEAKAPGRGAGFGVRFTGFLHPRAHELVDYLVDNLDTGKPLVSVGPKSLWPRWLAWGGAGLVAVIVGAVITSGVLHLVRGSAAEPSSGSAAEEVAAVVPPVNPAPDEVRPPAPEELEATVEVTPLVLDPVPAAAEVVAAPVLAARPLGGSAPAPAPKAVMIEKPPKAAKPAAGLTIPSGAVKSIGTTLAGAELTLTLGLGAGASIVRAFTLAKPDRLALDLKGAAPKRSYVLTGAGEITRVRVGRIAGGTRLVVDLARTPGKPTVSGATVSIPLQ